MIREILFFSMVPIPELYIRQDRFSDSDGWTITADGSTVTLSREAKPGHWLAVGEFTVHGVPYVLVRSIPEKPAKKK